MKKTIITVIITAIICIGGTALAYSYTANEIGYGNGTVKDAIDDLYTTANTTVTNLKNTNASLTQSNETLTEENETLTNQNSSLNNQVASLQNQVNNPNCVSDSYQKDANSQINIPLQFTPKKFMITFNNSLNDTLIGYITNQITNKTYTYMIHDGTYSVSESTIVRISNNSIVSSYSTSGTTGVYNASGTVYYIACK